ncbi:RtcB family protein [Stratiformator vulcanicus]|uniref:3'-phosphate/5'-hydroxy nucleic acid ligase n=1 Tax=Stratiformator vulcanicus TaxID=2527980 RepID=A0A517R2Z8_9PLAN|nr:RtcB family protein [Stratiformator vulcanicus]QDT38259.1 RNA-splicing ligase RtcB [Stratiformator vulcanicus]
MNNSQLRKIGVPDECLTPAMEAIQKLAAAGELRGRNMKKDFGWVLAEPERFVEDEHLGGFARAVIEEREFQPAEPIDYRTWGSDIDDQAHSQMRDACRIPLATNAALMPDAHVGYGLPIGGVLATEGTVIPYAVGVDIACRMKLSVFDVPTTAFSERFDDLKRSLEKGTRFGVGSSYGRSGRQDHDVMDRDWSITRITRENRDKAWNQLGTSGSGNHFVEYGELTLSERDDELGLDKGTYLALLSHSGSRGAGASVCSTYSGIARNYLPKRYEHLGRLAWLDLDSEAGQEYWAAMNLMGDYAAANHDVIHRRVSKLLGAEIVAGVENHHNFAWKERHGDRELIVHRKGATPAGEGVLGVIPGSMADPAYVVRGRGEPESLLSASHGAGRRMSRKKAKDTYNLKAVRGDLAAKGITILSAGADEVPGVYKNIGDVMREQEDLVEIVARFNPKVVKMCGDGSKAED